MADLTEEDYPGIQPLSNYRGLRYGPHFRPQNRGSQSAGVDGTNQKLRDPNLGSPFTFRVRPPATLVNALLGQGAAVTKGPFDPHLRKVFDDALNQLAVVEQRFAETPPLATAQEVEDARNALLGGRPAPNQNINIIETAQAANNNFSRQLKAQASFDARSFSPSSDTQGSGVSRPDDLIAGNGEKFNPDKIEGSSANQPAFSDLAQARDVLVQLNKMLATPPLTLLINPEQLTITYGKKQIYTDRNRFNYIFQSWGEEQVRLNVTGKSGGFVVGAVGGAGEVQRTNDGLQPTATDEPSGYQYASKWDSIAWQNLMSLFAFYRNNGYIYDGGGAGGGPSEAHLFIGSIEITYDQWVYVGNFENFSYQYTEDKQQGGVEFSFDFVVSFMFDRAQAGEIQKWKSPTPSPSEEFQTRVNAEFESIIGQGANATYTQTIPDGVGGASATCILDPQCNPFQSRRNPSQGEEVAPNVFLAPGRTSRGGNL